MAGEQALLALELPGRPEAAGAARKALSSLNGSLHLVSHERLLDAQLLVSELVTNAVRHGSRPEESISVTVHADDETMLVEVRDRGSGFDPNQLPERPPDAIQGWGLKLVAGLAHRWGARAEDDGQLVWFEIDRPGQPTLLQPNPSDPE